MKCIDQLSLLISGNKSLLNLQLFCNIPDSKEHGYNTDGTHQRVPVRKDFVSNAKHVVTHGCRHIFCECVQLEFVRIAVTTDLVLHDFSLRGTTS